jgi:hypothetical protein
MLSERIRKRLYRSEMREGTIKALERYVETNKITVDDISLIVRCISTVHSKGQCYCMDFEFVMKNGEILKKPFFEFEDGTYSFEELMKL